MPSLGLRRSHKDLSRWEPPTGSAEDFEVTAFDPPAHLVIRGVLGPFDAELEYNLESRTGGTLLVNEATLRPRGLAGAVGQLANSRIKAAVGDNLHVLKRILES